jgi:hypothetical protein
VLTEAEALRVEGPQKTAAARRSHRLSDYHRLPGLTRYPYRRALQLGPRAISSTRPLDVLMRAAGFAHVEVTDLTNEFLDIARDWVAEFGRHEQALRDILGDEFEERQADRRGDD